MNDSDSHLVLGHLSGIHGVRGWVKVYSHTDPREAILNYQPWLLGPEKRPVKIRAGKPHGKNVIVSLPGVDSPEEARAVLQQEICIPRDQLPEAGEKTWYWSDLLGLKVANGQGIELGTVERMMETGANDVMVLAGDRQRLVPFVIGQTVRNVDLDAGTIEVDWHEED